VTLFADRGTTVNRLRIRCGGIDPLVAQLRAGRLLDESAIQPAMLPPSAILCIRRLSDPRPGIVALDGAQPTPALWTEAVAASIRDMARGATRPGLGDMTPGAGAVLFADRAEMLACLAADWCAGRLAAFWWWRALLGNIGEARAVLSAWLTTPQYIAAALDELACRGGAATFVGRLVDADTRAMLDAVIAQHDLSWLGERLETLRYSKRPPGTLNSGDGIVAGAEADQEAPPASAVPRAPWTERVPESQPESLRIDQQCLLGIALMTRRAPAIVRTSRFAADVQRWLAFAGRRQSTGPSASDPQPAPSGNEPPIERRALIERLRHHHGPPAAQAKDGDPPSTPTVQTARAGAHTPTTFDSRHHPAPSVHFQWHEAHALSTVSREISEPAPRGFEPLDRSPEKAAQRVGAAAGRVHMQIERADPAARVAEPPAGRRRANVDAAASSIAPPGHAPPAAHELVSPLRATAATSSTSFERSGTERELAIAAPLASLESTAPVSIPRVYPASIETEVGGVFYVLNVALRLGFYGDFTMPAQPGLELSIWDFLALAGRALTPRPLRRDPVWVLFADLAGRVRAEAPGATFEPPDVWRVPAEWLDAFPEGGAWRWRQGVGRLRVLHPAGFASVDVPRDGNEDAIEQVERELSRYRATASSVGGDNADSRSAVLSAPRDAPSHGSSSALTWWMGCLMPYVRERLARALGTSPRRAGPLLCVQRARVTTTPTHVDVFFPLAGLPIEVRLSGVDRNPGWVPAADRVITFHYD